MKKYSLIQCLVAGIVILSLSSCRKQVVNFGCDGDSITAGDQWSATVAADLGVTTHHNVGMGTATWAAHDDTQEYGCEGFVGISMWWLPTDDPLEIRMRHNNCAIVHVQKFIAEVDEGQYPEPELFGFAMGTNDTDYEAMVAGAERAITTLQQRFPKCKIFVCTPIQTGSAEHNAQNREKIALLEPLCQRLGVAVVDCYNGVPIREEEENWMAQGKYLRDGLHPDKPGQELMGHYIASEVRRIFHLK